MIARGGEAFPLTLSDRLRPPGIGFGVGWIHVYPASIYADVLAEAERVAVHAVHALGLRDGIAFPQLIVSRRRLACASSRSRRGSRAARWPTSSATPSASTSSRWRCGRRSARRLPDELVLPQFKQPLAIRFLTAQPGPAADGQGALDRLARPGARGPGRRSGRHLPQVGETIRPVRLDGDRRGYVIATADTILEALERAEAAARLLEVEVE